MKDAYQEVFGDKARIMVVLSHPDDTEIFCGGSVCRLLKDGKQVRVVKMTNGNKGSRQESISEENLAKLREREDAASMKILGVTPENSICLNLGDGQIENNLTTIGLLANQIRLFKPDIIITHNPQDVVIHFAKGENWINHRDHRHTGTVAIDAAYPYSRDILFFPEHFKQKEAASHEVTNFLLVDYYGHSDEVGIDISDYVDTKLKALSAHTSQYPHDKAQNLIDYMNKIKGKYFERFRFVVAD